MSDVPEAANCNMSRERDFIVGQDGDGCWLAVEIHGRGGGLFITREAALRYALAETERRPGAVTIAPSTILLTLTHRRAA